MAKKPSFSKDWSMLSKVGSTAPLHESSASSQVSPPVPEETEPKKTQRTKRKHLGSVPVEFFEAHQRLLDKNLTRMDFSKYILDAVAEKLEKDGVLNRKLED